MRGNNIPTYSFLLSCLFQNLLFTFCADSKKLLQSFEISRGNLTEGELCTTRKRLKFSLTAHLEKEESLSILDERTE